MAPDNEEMEAFASAAAGVVMETESVPVISGSGVEDTAIDLPKSVLDYYINIEKVLVVLHCVHFILRPKWLSYSDSSAKFFIRMVFE